MNLAWGLLWSFLGGCHLVFEMVCSSIFFSLILVREEL